MRETAIVSRANHYIRIHGFFEEFSARVIQPFCRRNLFKLGKAPIPGTRKQKTIVTHVFARSNYDRTEFRLPSELFKDFMAFAEYAGYKPSRLRIEEEPEIEGLDVDFEFNPGFDGLRPGQDEWVNYMLDEGYIKVNNGATGFGKEQPLYSKIKVPGGWKRMGEMKIGTEVMAPDGTVTKVNGVFPKGKKAVYRFHFEDGRYADAGLEHLWRIYDINAPCTARFKRGKEIRTREEVESNRWRVVDTQELLKLQELPERWKRTYVQLIEPEDSPDKNFKIHPYVMGVLLGDGSTAGNDVAVTKPYQQLFDKVQSLLPDHLMCKWRPSSLNGNSHTFGITFKDGQKERTSDWHIRSSLKEMGVMGHRSWEKGIPVDYLHGSRAQRLALLQGLMDTDGTVGKIGDIIKSTGKRSTAKAGTPSFSSSSEQLALGVQYLVRSLGGIAKLTTRVPSYTYKGERKEGRLDYRVHIRYPRPEELFTLDHKRERSQLSQYTDSLKLRVKNIERIGDAECQCISVEHPDHLYVTDDFIVTHNTAMAIHSMVKTGKRTVITMQPRYVINWVKELYQFVKLEPGDLVVWEHPVPLLAEAVQAGTINPKVVIIPMSRIEVFLRKKVRDEPDLEDVMKVLNPGLRIHDEGHEAIHQMFLSLMYGNIKKLFVLSATLKADDPFTNKMYQVLYPIRYRLKDAEPENYIDVVAYLYRINIRRHRIKTEQFGSYNDKAFEESILKSEEMTKFYFRLADKMFQEYYLDRRRAGTKCLFFFSRVNMCLTMLEMFKKKYPDMDIESFTGEDSKKKDQKDKYLRHEVVITTPNSCGTGKDIPGLITVLCPHMVSSTQANKQIIGRLRPLLGKFNDEITPTFVFTVCVDLGKHGEYYDKRKVAFADKQKTFKRINSECSLE